MKAAKERSADLKKQMAKAAEEILGMEGQRDKATDQKFFLDMDNKIKAARRMIQEH